MRRRLSTATRARWIATIQGQRRAHSRLQTPLLWQRPVFPASPTHDIADEDALRTPTSVDSFVLFAPRAISVQSYDASLDTAFLRVTSDDNHSLNYGADVLGLALPERYVASHVVGQQSDATFQDDEVNPVSTMFDHHRLFSNFPFTTSTLHPLEASIVEHNTVIAQPIPSVTISPPINDVPSSRNKMLNLRKSVQEIASTSISFLPLLALSGKGMGVMGVNRLTQSFSDLRKLQVTRRDSTSTSSTSSSSHSTTSSICSTHTHKSA
ncbi:hypothetical protein BJ742DRAFT_874667 [Cladochytrium replicatum]|nr:hypothetical protein BJ742DRAFT_874667 [Cladochytrium replicatum]